MLKQLVSPVQALEEQIDGVVGKTIDAAKATYRSSMKGTLYGGQAKNQDELSDAVLNSAEAKEERVHSPGPWRFFFAPAPVIVSHPRWHDSSSRSSGHVL